MPKTFTITTTAAETIKSDAKGHAEAVFTVTNTTSRPVRGMAKATPLDGTRQEWLKIAGETDRDFAAGGTQQFVVTFDAPVAAAPPPGARPPAAATPAGPSAADRCGFRLDVALATNPDEDFTEGQAVNVELPKPAAKPAPTPFPKWIILVIIAIFLVVGGVVLVLVLKSSNGGDNDNDETPTPTPVASPTPKPAPTFNGNWNNSDKNTSGVTRLEIQQTGNEIKVHAFGKCSPKDCDWGTESGALIGNTAQVTWDQGFSIRKMVLTLNGDNGLKMVLDTAFTDNRPRQHAEADFTRVRRALDNAVIKPNTGVISP
jgi:hypothetical protein